jgi:outer membrane receptor protein involved in Fe transport
LIRSLALSTVLLLTHAAAAQDMAVPILVFENEEDDDSATAVDDELDLANLVTSAAKGSTAVQEAPAIVSVLPEQDLRQLHGRTLGEVMDLVPGFLRFEAFNGQFSQVLVRGVMQATLQLHDGVSMFDFMGNSSTIHRALPMEMVKRIEAISGPGGVLWGANSFLGVVNVITKDAEDIDGVQASLGLADGKGDRQAGRAYVLAGIPRLFGCDTCGLVLHTSFESYIGPIYTRAGQLFSQPVPNPNSLYYYGPVRDTDPQRSSILDLDAKLTLGGLTVQVFAPFVERYMGIGFNGGLAVHDLTEDHLPECQGADPSNTGDHCYDPAHAARVSRLDHFERYGIVDYRARFGESAGVNVKGYLIQFLRDFDPLIVLPPTPGLLEGGLAFTALITGYRAGGSVDGDLELGSQLRLLYGFESFHEWMVDSTKGSREGAGLEATFLSPYDLGRLPFACPRTASWDPVNRAPTMSHLVAGCPVTLVFAASRTTIGGFASAQLRPSSRLILDFGARLQAAPDVAADSRSYGVTPTLSAAAVYEFVAGWHVKINYAEGFRAPVFNNTDANGEAVDIGGSPDLQVETSRALQGEVNARLLKGVRAIRELDLRADYSYTTLDHFISFIGGRYANTGERGIHSAELLAKLYLKGGHWLELGYTYNRIDMSDKGAFHAMPNNWFNLAAVHQLVPDRLELTTVLRVYGAFEDPNRRVEARGLAVDPMTGSATPGNPDQSVAVDPDEVAIDRAPPAADVQVGVRWRLLGDSLELQATVYNAFDDERFAYDNSNDLEPRFEIVPGNFEAFRAYASATYKF